MAMTPLPAAPQRDQDPATFATTADTFVAALPGFVTEANALEAAVDADATTATTQAGIATTQAGIATAAQASATASAASALSSANAAAISETNAANSATALTATSTTSNTVGLGSKVFTVQTGKQFVAGQYVQAISGSNWMFGTVTSYVTDQLTINVTDTNGSGTFASWAIAVSGIKGIQGIAGAGNIPYSARTSNTQITLSERSYFIDITSGTFSQTFDAASALGSGWFCYIRNSGTGDVTLDPSGSETIDGLSSFVMYPNEARLIQCDGTALRSVVIQPFSKTITSSTNFIKPPGYAQFEGLLWAAGASGRKDSAAAVAVGGTGGACAHFVLSSSSVSASEAVTIGLGGSAITTNATNGNDGGNSTFAGITSYGGKGGNNGAVLTGGAAYFLNATNDVLSGASTGAATQAYYGGASSGVVTGRGPTVFGGGAGGSIDAGGVLWFEGVTKFGGQGGVASAASSGTDGTAPGGGGGATRTGAQSGAGARGELRIWGIC